MSVHQDKRIVYRMDRDRRDQLEFFVDTWVEAVQDGEQMPEESGTLIPEDEWNWVKAEVRRRTERVSQNENID